MIDFKEPKRLSVAPMIDWTTPEYRYFARLLNPHAHLYTEMISTSAILYGNTERLLRHDDMEQPLVLQLGGSHGEQMTQCVMIGQQHGFNEFMKTFVEQVAEAGCRRFIVHARIAWLQGLSPKQNRDIPPLRYDDVYRLKQDFKSLQIEINGGIDDIEQIKQHLHHVDGVMIGRAFYHNPYLLAECNQLWGSAVPTRRQIIEQLLPYLQQQVDNGEPLMTMVRHYLGLFQGLSGARKWRQALSGKRTMTVAQVADAAEQVLMANPDV